MPPSLPHDRGGAAAVTSRPVPRHAAPISPAATFLAPVVAGAGSSTGEPLSPAVASPSIRVHRMSRRGGYTLAADTFGAEDGVPVFFMHGMPGSRSGPYPRGVVLRRRGVRLVAYDRPGYGDSTRDVGRSVADAADDVRAIADQLEIKKFAVAGRSGGGPYALAAAARMPDRVTAVAVLVGFAPVREVNGWHDGMLQDSIDTYDMAENEQELLAHLTETARLTREDPENFIDEWVRPGLSSTDLRVVKNFDIRRQLKATYLEALRDGNAYGWADDVIALRRDWEFELTEVKAPTLLWHGADDKFSPVRHAYWLASRIADHDVVVADAGHFGAIEALPGVLSWLAQRHAAAVAGEG